MKRCLRKTIGRARLTYDELLTSITEAEMILNSRPISYVSADDTEEALTPSHLLHGCRILSLPGPIGDIDETDDGDQGSPDLSRRLKHLEKTMSDFWRRSICTSSEKPIVMQRDSRDKTGSLQWETL